jgi:hypothetical protein
MSTKVLFKMMLPFGLLAVVFLATQIASSKSAIAPAEKAVAVDQSIAGPEIMDNLTASQKSNYYAGSDYIERHPPASLDADYFAGSDWIERHPSNFFAGSDYIERHPPMTTVTKYLAGSEWFESHR